MVLLSLKAYLKYMIEMMVVLIIIAVLIGVGIKFYLGYIENSKVTKAKGQISNMQALMDSWYAEKGEYPLSQTDEGDNTDLKADGCELREAGFKATKIDSGKEYIEDPWGGDNYYTFNVKLDKTKYYIKTKYANVNGTGKPVSGTGEKGVSNTPAVETPASL